MVPPTFASMDQHAFQGEPNEPPMRRLATVDVVVVVVSLMLLLSAAVSTGVTCGRAQPLSASVDLDQEIVYQWVRAL